MTQGFEKLGAFYLGKQYDLSSRSLMEDLVLYDSRDLTTHAVLIGMTGSGKTGLGIGLMEEALIDNIPVIAIDPKGDLPNLMLTFPDLAPSDFLPWIDSQDALRSGMSPEKFAADQADLWRRGLAQWGQTPERIAKLKAAADFTVYTPGSSAGRPVSVLRNFSPPPESAVKDTDALRDRIQTTTTGLLALLGIEADPLTSREHILLANIFENAWSHGHGLDLAMLIQAIQAPPFERIGVMDLEFFYPAKERFTLAMRINNLLAAPGFEAWMAGDPLDIGRLLVTPQGKPRASIFTISHLSDTERMFFVTMLLNEIVGWMRTQQGTSSLRAVLYMDEIFGYFPPVSNPPSKAPLLTLLKQARAYGLGVVLATQNPVDLDYKGLSNTGTWCIGRLQTERDKERLLAGLEGAAAGSGFDRRQMEETLAGLGKRVFLLHNVHENAPVIFQTRWTLSYLRGPMTREQIKDLDAPQPAVSARLQWTDGSPVDTEAAAPWVASPPSRASGTPPAGPPGIDVFYMPASGAGSGLIYRPAVIGCLDVHYSNTKYGVDTSIPLALAGALEDGPVTLDWDAATEFTAAALESSPLSGAEYGDLPSDANKASAYSKWGRDLLRWVRLNRPLMLYRSERLGLSSQVGESEGAFRARLGHAMRESRDLEAEKLRGKYNRRFVTLQDRLMRAEQAIAREQEQAKAQTVQTAISFGTAILGAFLGRKAVSVGSATRVGTAARSASRIGKEKMDVARARQRTEAVRSQLADLEDKLQEDMDRLDLSFDPETEELKTIAIKPKAADITLELFGLAWLPLRRDAAGDTVPDWI